MFKADIRRSAWPVTTPCCGACHRSVAGPIEPAAQVRQSDGRLHPRPRAPERVIASAGRGHPLRVLMIAAGYQNGDADSLRHDPLFKLAMQRLPDAADLCSQFTVSRPENLPSGTPAGSMRPVQLEVATHDV